MQSFKDNKVSLLQHFVGRAHLTDSAEIKSGALEPRPQPDPCGNAFVGQTKVRRVCLITCD